ncbi:PadR family transcriptional regulator [Nocardia sp. NPDC005978]|uniref:PadR family transcriptional regulator n=1 Tax=Nocardia sp. NPDC005978 TaxID=3156725 RepID=UPI0033B2BB53
MARKRKVGNLMALAVLSVLATGDMHRYEIAARLRAWGKDRDMGVKWGSLYTVVDNLTRHGFLEIAGSERDGARPERTIYRITDAGRAELADWARELISTPMPEQRPFMAGLSVLAALPPDDVVELLGTRIAALERTIAEQRAQLSTLESTLPRLFLIEDEYELAMLEAEAHWARTTRDALADGTFPEIGTWRAWHLAGTTPAEVVTEVEGGAPGAQPPDTNSR